MHLTLPHASIVFCLSLALVAGCASEGSIKSAETLDERTGMTVGSLEKPLELIPNAQFATLPNRPMSFAYLGPVEWDNMGTITYGLWVHLVPASDWHFENIKSPHAVALALDDGAMALKTIDAPSLARGPYHPVASWGQTAYFELDLPTLKRMASSQKIELDFQAQGGATVRFAAAPDAHETLLRYLHARGY